MEFTLGIEEEYQVIDPESRELASHDQKVVDFIMKETLIETV